MRSVPAWAMQKVQGSLDNGDFRDFVSDKQNHDCTETVNIEVTALSAVISRSQLPIGLCLSLQNTSTGPVSLGTTLGLITQGNCADRWIMLTVQAHQRQMVYICWESPLAVLSRSTKGNLESSFLILHLLVMGKLRTTLQRDCPQVKQEVVLAAASDSCAELFREKAARHGLFQPRVTRLTRQNAPDLKLKSKSVKYHISSLKCKAHQLQGL